MGAVDRGTVSTANSNAPIPHDVIPPQSSSDEIRQAFIDDKIGREVELTRRRRKFRLDGRLSRVFFDRPTKLFPGVNENDLSIQDRNLTASRRVARRYAYDRRVLADSGIDPTRMPHREGMEVTRKLIEVLLNPRISTKDGFEIILAAAPEMTERETNYLTDGFWYDLGRWILDQSLTGPDARRSFEDVISAMDQVERDDLMRTVEASAEHGYPIENAQLMSYPRFVVPMRLLAYRLPDARKKYAASMLTVVGEVVRNLASMATKDSMRDLEAAAADVRDSLRRMREAKHDSPWHTAERAVRSRFDPNSNKMSHRAVEVLLNSLDRWIPNSVFKAARICGGHTADGIIHSIWRAVRRDFPELKPFVKMQTSRRDRCSGLKIATGEAPQ